MRGGMYAYSLVSLESMNSSGSEDVGSVIFRSVFSKPHPAAVQPLPQVRGWLGRFGSEAVISSGLHDQFHPQDDLPVRLNAPHVHT